MTTVKLAVLILFLRADTDILSGREPDLFALAVTRFGAANRRGSAALLVGLVLWSRWSAGFGVARLRRGHLGEKWLRAMDSASSIRREPDVIEHDVHHVERAVRRLRRLNGAQ